MAEKRVFAKFGWLPCSPRELGQNPTFEDYWCLDGEGRLDCLFSAYRSCGWNASSTYCLEEGPLRNTCHRRVPIVLPDPVTANYLISHK
jgi:hypothetical protein